MYTLAVMSREPNSPADEAQRFFSSLRFLKEPPPPPVPRRRALTVREVAAARGALKSLRRLAAAEAVAPDYDEYGKLLLDVKGEVDDYVSDVGPGEVRDEIELALEAYTDLRVAWNATRGSLAMPAALYQPQRTLIATYGIPIEVRGEVLLMDFKWIDLRHLQGRARAYRPRLGAGAAVVMSYSGSPATCPPNFRSLKTVRHLRAVIQSVEYHMQMEYWNE